MLKPLIFTSLYALAGFTGWGAYSVINEEDTSITSIKNFAQVTNAKLFKTAEEKEHNIYRYKNKNNEWTYSDTPPSPEVSQNFEQELEFLKTLPQEVMPTQDFKTLQQNKAVASSLLEAVSHSDGPKVNKLIEEAKRVVGLIEDRNKMLSDISNLTDPEKMNPRKN
ncbi:MAG: hypothetical protein R3240_00760 [Gammaproteobacteria bacterium]|nr:hypothetical protein [Gammaproteobacteria bacterium]